eukprot:scaffold16248_cov72-Skeletonema_dohrnii-CCMP3373.AAC.1
MCCAACGIAEVDDIKLKDCDACKSIRYCSEDCQRNHRQQHEQKCKKRAAELRDEILFKQPENSCYGDCPICCLPLPVDGRMKNMFQTCCSTVICDGCCYANQLHKGINAKRCPFCRHPFPATTAEAEANTMKRIEVNDPAAIRQMGVNCCKKEQFDTAFQYLTKAAELGDIVAHYQLSLMYKNGEVAEKDEKKRVYHLEEAAIGGHPGARYELGTVEVRIGMERMDRAIKHWMIGANLGDEQSLTVLKLSYPVFVIKEDFAAALRAYQTAVDGMKSPDREVAAEIAKQENY